MNKGEQQTGIVKWFSYQRGYGFIVCDSGAEAFVHHNDIQMGGYRHLKRGQRVSFILDDQGDSLKATHVVPEENAASTPLEKPSDEPRRANAAIRSYRLQETVEVEEDREHEFKSLQKAKDPVKTIAEYYAEKYINAFLNTNGGVIFFGIADDGKVQGVELDRRQRDHLRTKISKIINAFQPSVEPELYKLDFVDVAGKDSLYVVEVHVTKGTANLYMTGSQNFYLRRDGSNFLMPFDMIRTRLQTQAEESSLLASEAIAPKAHTENQPQDQSLAATDLDLGLLLSMVFMSWSDSKLSDSEKQLLEIRARDEGLDEQDVNILMQAAIEAPLLETIEAYLPTAESRKAAATAAYLTALNDNILTEEELLAFEKMCEALGLSEAERQDVRKLGEQQLGQSN